MMVTKLEYREILHIMTNKLCFQESAREIFKFIYPKNKDCLCTNQFCK